MRKTFFAVLIATLLVAAIPPVDAKPVEGGFLNRGHFYASATVEACTNHPGPFVTLSGEIVLGGIDGKVIFRNNRKGTHEADADVSMEITLIPEGESISFVKQPSQGGVGGNPWIYIQFFDADWNPLTDLTLLGRCVQGLVPMDFA